MNIRRVLGVLLIPVTVATLVGACGKHTTSRDPGMTVFVAGNRSNMPTPKLVGKAVDWANDAASSDDTVWIYSVSGRPEQIGSRDVIKNPCDNTNGCNAFGNSFRAKINSELAGIVPTSGEADTFGAIVAAAQLFGDFTGPRQIVVIDNGLQTTGELLLQTPGAFAADPATLAQELSGYPGVEKLRGVRILLSALGSYADPQPQLSLALEGKLTQLWTSLLTSLGAEVTTDTTVLSGPAPVGLPAVTVVKEDPPVVVTPKGCVRLREDQVGFLPDQAVFRDEAQSAKVLGPVADAINSSAGVRVNVIGTTALPEDPPYPLSTARANAVIDVLVELGVPRDQLTAEGVGTNFGGYINPVGADGIFNETLGPQDRLVIIQPVGAQC